MNNKEIDIIFITGTSTNLFDNEQISKLKEIGNVIFCSRENFVKKNNI